VPLRRHDLVNPRKASTGVFFNTYRPAGSLPRRSRQSGNASVAEVTRRKKIVTEAYAP